MTLLAILSPVLAFFAGLWAATYLQDRQARRRHLGLARALLAELARIHDEAGMKSARYVGVGSGGLWAAIPQLSEWTTGYVAELASGDTDVLGEFIRLERCLKNLHASNDQLHSAAADEERMRAQLEFTRQTAPDDVAGVVKCQQLAEAAEQRANDARSSLDCDFENAKALVHSLQASLALAEPRLARGLHTHLPWASDRA